MRILIVDGVDLSAFRRSARSNNDNGTMLTLRMYSWILDIGTLGNGNIIPVVDVSMFDIGDNGDTVGARVGDVGGSK